MSVSVSVRKNALYVYLIFPHTSTHVPCNVSVCENVHFAHNTHLISTAISSIAGPVALPRRWIPDVTTLEVPSSKITDTSGRWLKRKRSISTSWHTELRRTKEMFGSTGT